MPRPGAPPTNGIAIEVEIQPKFGVLWVIMCFTNYNAILHTSHNCSCRNVCKISLWSVEYIFNQENSKFWKICEFVQNTVSGTGARCWMYRAPIHCSLFNLPQLEVNIIYIQKHIHIWWYNVMSHHCIQVLCHLTAEKIGLVPNLPTSCIPVTH